MDSVLNLPAGPYVSTDNNVILGTQWVEIYWFHVTFHLLSEFVPVILLVNHTKPTNTLYWNWYLLTVGNYKSASEQLQNSTVNSAISLTINRVINCEIGLINFSLTLSTCCKYIHLLQVYVSYLFDWFWLRLWRLHWQYLTVRKLLKLWSMVINKLSSWWFI